MPALLGLLGANTEQKQKTVLEDRKNKVKKKKHKISNKSEERKVMDSATGAELELDWRFQSGAITRFTYAYQDTKTDNVKLKESTTPIMMSFFGSMPLTDRLAINGYYWYGKELAGRDYEFINSWLSYKFALGGYSKATMGVGMEARLDDNALVSRHNNLTEDAFAYVFTNVTF